MTIHQPLSILPFEFQRDWRAGLEREVSPRVKGHFYLVDIQSTAGNGFQGQRITVRIIDEDGHPMSNIPVAFSYSTADPLYLSQDFRWVPPTSRAFVAPTQGSGQIDQVQGSVVRAGEPGGVTVFAFMPQYSSDAISGMGMLADHTGVLLTLQLQREGVVSVQDRFKVIEARLEALERAVNRWPE